jgi:hypothetical protein
VRCCACNAGKEARHAFCGHCFGVLPVELQEQVRRGDVAAAKAWLFKDDQ